MEFCCESLHATISPSLSETTEIHQESTTEEQNNSVSQSTPKRLKRKKRRSREFKAKRCNSTFQEPSADHTMDYVDRKVQSNKGIKSADKSILHTRFKEWFNCISSIPNRKGNVSLEDIIKTSPVGRISPLENDSLQNELNLTSDLSQNSDEKDSVSCEKEILEEQEETIDEVQYSENVERIVEDVQKSTVSKIKYIDLDESKVMVLEQNTVVYLQGVVRITVLRGAVEVLGYVISSAKKAVDLFSPKGTSFLYIKPLKTDNPLGININASFSQNEEIVNFIEQQTYDSCVILCETVQSSHISYIEKHIAQQIYPKQDNSQRYIFEEHPVDWNVVKVSSDWERICETVSPHCKVFLCGGKGVGKSTFLRYAVNRLLTKYEKVRVVDLDPGQPEFTVPGCVSVHTITEPVFGPNYTHIRKPERCIFLPSVNVAYNPREYIHAIQELLSVYRSEDELPTLINYMGFSLGIGLNIACSVIAELKPTTVVQIQSQNQKKNFSRLLTPDCIVENMLLRRLLPVNVTPEELSYQFVALDSMSDDCSGFTFQPRQIREMCVLAYMSQVFSEDVCSLTDAAVSIYKSSLENVTLIANGAECHPAVVNGNLVALCVKQGVHDDGAIYRCYGWGVVRGIDPNTKQLYLITPVARDTLEVVTHLIYGSVNLPPSVYMTAEDVSGVVPYVSLGTLTSFSSIPKRTHLPKQTTKSK